MPLTLGLIGLPNVGKSTIFNALTAGNASAENFPFCTIDPNHGIIGIPDNRLERLARIAPAEKTVPASLEVIDIAGLVKNAAQGEGLGNQFLSHVRNADMLVHIVRCFADENIVHVDGTIDPVRDIEIIETELLLKDLETVENALEKARKASKSGTRDDKAREETLAQLHDALAKGNPARTEMAATPSSLSDLRLLTAKPIVYVANVGEDDLSCQSPHITALKQAAEQRGAPWLALCGTIEAELLDLPEEERNDFIQGLGISEPGLPVLARTVFKGLGLETFFTSNNNENHAWPIPVGTRAPQAAGKIHTDFEKGFIKAEVYQLDDVERYGSFSEVRAAGKMRLEGQEYVVQDGDIIQFKFNV